MINQGVFVLKTCFFHQAKVIQPIPAISSCYLHVGMERAFHPLKQSSFTFTGITAVFYCLCIFNGSVLRFHLTKEWYSLPEEVNVRLVLVSAPPSWHLLMLHLHFLSWATTVPRSWTCLKALWPGNCFILADSAIPNLPDAGSAEACGGMGGEN